jgi:glyoxylase-like metal-dependent hydrolase (beta-lactamase superfamily II)
MPVVHRVALAYNNVYLVDSGGGRVMVDTGPDYRGAFEALEQALEGRSPDVVVATHGHVDHAGLGAHWQARGVPVSLGAADHELAAGPSAAYLREVALLEAYLDSAGAPAEVAAEALAGLDRRKTWAREIATQGAYQPSGRGGRWPTALRYDAFEASTVGQQSGRLGPLQAVACPGHTPGNVVLVEPRKAGFSGDQPPEMTPTPALQRAPGQTIWRFRSLPAFVAAAPSGERAHALLPATASPSTT